MAASFQLLLILGMLHDVSCEVVDCPNNANCGPCSADELCTLDCSGMDNCHNNAACDYAGFQLNCKTGYTCSVLCPDDSSCENTIINAVSATDVTVDCNGDSQSCKRITITSGTGSLDVDCGDGASSISLGCRLASIDATASTDVFI